MATASVSGLQQSPGLQDQNRQSQGEWQTRRFRLPLQAAAALGVIVLLTVVVLALSWQSYRASRDAVLTALDDTVGFMRDTISETIRRQLDPADLQLDFVVRSPLSEATTLPDRLKLVPLMVDALKHNPLLAAIYMGYPNGEFVLFRPLTDDTAMQKQLQAPVGAALVVQTQTWQDNVGMIGEYRFYDDKNGLIGSRVDPAYKFDPRTRSWYTLAVGSTDLVLTEPYVYFTTHRPGITLARVSADGGGVVGMDINISGLGEQVAAIKITPSTEIALVSRLGMVVGYKDMTKAMVSEADGGARFATIDELKSEPLSAAAALIVPTGMRSTRGKIDSGGQGWQIIQSTVDVLDARKVKLLIAIPNDEFFAAARSLVVRQFQIVGLIMVAACVVAWFLTSFMVKPLRRLARETAKIERFDFGSTTRVGSSFGEIDDLGRALFRMKQTILQFLNIGQALAAERNFKPLLEKVLLETIDVVQSDGGAIYMLNDDLSALNPEMVRWKEKAAIREETVVEPIGLDRGGVIEQIAKALHAREIVVVERHLEETELRALGLHAMVHALNIASLALIVVPLLDRYQVPFGVMILTKGVGAITKAWNADKRHIELVHAVSGSASVAIQNNLLLEAQKALIDSLIKLVAGAIDAKSAYTGGHCQRVPVLTRLLAEAAAAQKTGPYRDFKPTDEEWEALDTAAWLHDCGKVTMPEYVVDKATKLETIYDRIHEIRMRFELLKSAAATAYWKGIAVGGDEASLRLQMLTEQQQLDEEFAFVATANEGGEFMEPAKIERIKKIAARRWVRTLSNRLGVSYEERARFDRDPEPPLPVEEPLLADRSDHIVELAERDIIRTDNMWGFQLTVPKVKYNRGEVYNLCIQKGTLTEEERYRINDHIVQTIIMLDSLPFPKHLKNVPELAGGHHEKMDGTGYPKRLKGEDMSVVARMMAVADVFEALTAADRPYKKAKKLSEAVKIMGFMKKDRHLDPDVLDLFLTSGVWRVYAERFLSPEQIDEPDIAAVLGIRPAA
jgi:HD-GYP domain-containing protein (c-di-GMP phosphodiesterase class II)